MRKITFAASRLAATAILFIAFDHAEARILNVPEDYQTIQAGINASEDGDTVLVQPGEYQGTVDFAGRNIVLASQFLTNNDQAVIDSTVINGGDNGRGVVVIRNGEDETAQLVGFTIQGGETEDGGGIYVLEAAPTLRNLVVRDNQASHRGGGIFCEYHSRPHIRDVVVADNLAGTVGGGIYIDGFGEALITNTIITGNRAELAAGGFVCTESNASLDSVIVSGNFAGRDGGVDALGSSFLEIRHSVITENAGNGANFWIGSGGFLDHVIIAGNTGSGVYGYNAAVSITNCAITGNGGSHEIIGSWEYEELPASFLIVNSIVWGNVERQYDIWCAEPVQAFIDFSDVRNGREGVSSIALVWGDDNIDADPLFLDPDNGDYRLTVDSPCIDAGDPESHLDPDGTRADMGVFYFHQRDIEVEPEAVRFPPMAVGEFDSLSLPIRNVGGTDLFITHIAAFENMSWVYVHAFFDEENPIIVPPGEEYLLWFYARPDNDLLEGGSFFIHSNDPDEPDVMVFASGEIENAALNDQLSAFSFQLFPAYPNPFNAMTRIRFSVGARHAVPLRLAVFGIDGRMVADLLTGHPPLVPPASGGGKREASPASGGGNYSVVWNAEGLPGGVYLVRLEAGSQVQTIKTILLK